MRKLFSFFGQSAKPSRAPAPPESIESLLSHISDLAHWSKASSAQRDAVRITITVPASLRKELKVRAAQNDRSFSGEIVHCLKVGSGWQDATAQK